MHSGELSPVWIYQNECRDWCILPRDKRDGSGNYRSCQACNCRQCRRHDGTGDVQTYPFRVRDIIVEDGTRHGNVEVRKRDLNCYGTATRPVHLSLAYNDDPFIQGISNNPEGARQFLKRLGVRRQNDDPSLVTLGRDAG